MRSGLKAEQLEKKYWEGMGYQCRIFPKTKFYAQDFFGYDVACVNKNQWVLTQVKSSSGRMPSFENKVRREMTKTPMPPETAKFWTGYNFKTGKIKRIQLT